jgi:2-oxoglutarate dehydrogenase E1 component
LRELTGGQIPLSYLGRPDRASPAEGSLYIHNEEQARIIEAAFANLPATGSGGANGSARNGKRLEAEPALSSTAKRKK